MQSRSIKFNYNGEFRRLAVSHSNPTVAELIEKASKVFPLQGEAFYFSWIDEDGDSIKFNSDEELHDALSYFERTGTSVFKFDIEISRSPSNQKPCFSRQKSQSVHRYVTCDECGMKPIKGIRYKCAVRDDFDLCESCEAKKLQPHPMLKIYHPDQSPSAISIHSRLEGLCCPRKPHCGRSRGPHRGLFTQGPGCGSRMEKWARCAKVFVDSIGEANNSVPLATEMKPSDSSVSADGADIEQRIIDDVIRMSIEETSSVDSHPLSQPSTGDRSADSSETMTSASTKPSEAGKVSSGPLPLRSHVSVTAIPITERDIADAAGVKNAAMGIWYRVYETELKALNEMGFYDVDAMIPLLREHVKTPASSSSSRGDTATSEAMQRVVLALLGHTMTTRRP